MAREPESASPPHVANFHTLDIPDSSSMQVTLVVAEFL
jgi:hypothetical protein